MAINPQTPSSLLRGFGADSTSLEKKLKIAAKEAEQRWPIIREIPPTKGADPAPLTPEEKALWNAQVPERAATRKPTLTLPSLGDKFSVNLEKLVKPKSNLIQPTKSADTTTVTRTEFSIEQSTESAPASTMVEVAKIPTRAEANAVESSPSAASEQAVNFFNRQSKLSQKTNDPEAEDKSSRSLFTPASPLAATTMTQQPKTNSHVLFSQRTNALTTSDQPVKSLLQVFARIEGKELTVEVARPKSVKSFMHRITKR